MAKEKNENNETPRRKLVDIRDIREVAVLTRGKHVHLTVARSFVGSLLGELAGDDVVSLAVFVHQVQRHSRKLRGRAALQKQHLVVVRGNPLHCPQSHRRRSHHCYGGQQFAARKNPPVRKSVCLQNAA